MDARTRENLAVVGRLCPFTDAERAAFPEFMRLRVPMLWVTGNDVLTACREHPEEALRWLVTQSHRTDAELLALLPPVQE